MSDLSSHYNIDYVESLKDSAKEMVAAIEGLNAAIRNMPNIEDDPKKAVDCFDELVNKKFIADIALKRYYKNEIDNYDFKLSRKPKNN
jgi:hypothetical protein